VLSVERRERILRILRQGRYAAVGDIAAVAGSSEATVRRDLAQMETEGLVRRVRGGAELAEGAAGGGSSEPPLEYRKGVRLAAKRRIAEAAAGLCADGETVIIDGGSTTFQMTDFLAARTLTVITNSFAIAEPLVHRSLCTVILAGGIVNPESQLILDPFAANMFANYTASKVFMGVFGIDETGATNTESLLITTEKAMIERARELVVLADSSKIGRRGSLFLCPWEKIGTIITDDGVSAEWRALCAARGVRLLVV
jgi:DeoR family transcriptional regulator, ulaG and ulaABCDEF operon transcriptional repressor